MKTQSLETFHAQRLEVRLVLLCFACGEGTVEVDVCRVPRQNPQMDSITDI